MTSRAEKLQSLGQSVWLDFIRRDHLLSGEFDRMVRDAESHAEDDRRRRDEAEIRNNADTLVYQTEKLLREQGEKFSGGEKDQVETVLKSLKDALAGSDVEAIRKATEGLATASQGFAQRLYEQAAKDGAASGEGGAAGGSGSQAHHDDEVVDAEIVDEQGA